MTSTEKLEDGKTTVQSVGGYHLVTHGTWQVTVMMDATVSLPRLVRPEDIDDFCNAMQAAKDVALKVRADNESQQQAELEQRQEQIETAREMSSRRQRNAAKAKKTASARTSGRKATSKTESESAQTEES